MKILYIAHYKEKGGWAQAATNQILALDKVGVDVVCRNVTLTQDKQDIHPTLTRLENKTTKDCDVLIQHVLPHHLIGSTSFFKKNVAFFEGESTSIKKLRWVEYLKMVDEVWVPNWDLQKSLSEDGVQNVNVVYHPCDLEKYTRPYPNINIAQARGKFKFYYIGDLNDRKNLETIITCFHSEFDTSEEVALILKINKFGHSPAQVKEKIDQLINKVKTQLRMYPGIEKYHRDIIVAEEISEENIFSLHRHCDCFICPSYGEAWSIPSFDAMALGNTPICSKFGGPKEFITSRDTGYLVDGVYKVCKCTDAAFPDIFTGREFWFNACEKQICDAMRYYYENNRKLNYQKAGLERAQNFSFEKIGNHMKEMLSE